MNFLKKILKIGALYILFGILISIIISVFAGAYQNLIIVQTMGNMQLKEFIFLNGYVVLLWLPMKIAMSVSKMNFYRDPYIQLASIIIIIVFFMLCIKIILKKKN